MYKLNLERRIDFKDLLWIQGADRAIPPTGLADVRNFIYTDKGRLRLRGGFKALNSTPLPGPVVGMAQVPWDVSDMKFACASATGIYTWDEEVQLFNLIYNLQTRDKPTVFDAYGGHLLFCNGTDPMMHFNGAICQEVIKPVEGWYADQQPSFVIIHKDRAWCVVGPMIYMSDLQVPYDFKNGSASQFPTGNSDPVSTLVESLDRLFVIKDKSIGFIYQPSNEYSLYMGTTTPGDWVYKKAYSSVTGTPSPFGACGFGEMFYYGSPDGLFEVNSTGRESIGNLNTSRIELLGIAPLFSVGCSEHLNFDSFDRLLVIPHLRRNEVWFFVGNSDKVMNKILVFSRALKRWTIFTVPNCKSACSYVTGIQRRVIAIGTENGYIGISDQDFSGKDMGVDFVGNSYIDFIWSGLDLGEFCKSWRMFTPVIQGDQFVYSTMFDGCRPGKTNVPIVMLDSPDGISHEVPMELDGKGFYCKTRIAGAAGHWPLEIEALFAGSKMVRQRRFSQLFTMGEWSVDTPTDFIRNIFPIADWTNNFGLNKWFLGNTKAQVQAVEYKTAHYINSDQVILTNLPGSGYFILVTGVYLKATEFKYDDFWAEPNDPSTVNYFDSFVNDPDTLSTTINISPTLPDGTEVIIRYLYQDVEAIISKYQPIIIRPSVQVTVDRFYWSSNNLGRLIFLLSIYRDTYPTVAPLVDTMIKFLWKQILYVSGELDKSIYSINPADGKTSITHGISSALAGTMLVEFNDNIEDFKGPGVDLLFQPTSPTAYGWFGYFLDWASAIINKLVGVTFTFMGASSGQMIRVCLSTVPESTAPVVDENLYIAGLPDISAEVADVMIPINQFYKKNTILWDGIRNDPTGIISTYSSGATTVVSFDKVYEGAFITPEADTMYAYLRWSCPDAGITYMQTVIPVTGLDSASLHSGLCFLYRISDAARNPTITVTIHKLGGTSYVASFVHPGGTGWIRKSLLWAAFTGFVAGDIDSITIKITTSTNLDFTDIAYCDAGSLPVRQRFSDEATYCRSLLFLMQNDSETKIIQFYNTAANVYYPTGGANYRGAWQMTTIPHTLVKSTGIVTPSTINIKLTNIGFTFSESDIYPYTVPNEALITPQGLIGFRGPIIISEINPFIASITNELKCDHAIPGQLSRKRLLADSKRTRGLGYFPIQGRLLYENLSTCGGLNSFEWDRKWSTKGLEVGAWVYADTLWQNLTIKDGLFLFDLTQAATRPAFVAGLRDSVVDSAAAFIDGGTGIASIVDTDFDELNSIDADPIAGFTLTLILQAAVQAGDHKVFIQHWNTGTTKGWQVRSALTGTTTLELYFNDGTPQTVTLPNVLDGNKHIVQFAVERYGAGTFHVSTRLDGVEIGAVQDITYLPTAALASPFEFGVSGTFNLDLVKIDLRHISLEEFVDFCKVINGETNVSNIPQCGTVVGQLKTIKHLIIEQGIHGAYLPDFDLIPDVDTCPDIDGAVEESLFTDIETLLNYYYIHPYGQTINTLDTSDPSPLAQACEAAIMLYWLTGETATVQEAIITGWLDTLRSYISVDGLVGDTTKYTSMLINLLKPFALAIYEMANWTVTNHFPMTATNIAFWQDQIVALRAKSGNTKPNYLNTDLLPYFYYNDEDYFSTAELIERNLGEIDTVVYLAGIALNYAKQTGDYLWFKTLINFIIKVTY